MNNDFSLKDAEFLLANKLGLTDLTFEVTEGEPGDPEIMVASLNPESLGLISRFGESFTLTGKVTKRFHYTEIEFTLGFFVRFRGNQTFKIGSLFLMNGEKEGKRLWMPYDSPLCFEV